jgi:SAM-dependent methyltransferase
MTRDDVRANLASWEADSAEYQRTHAAQLNTDWDRLAWGTWGIPEDDVHALGDVDGLDALELGCGAGQFGIRVAKRGAAVVGLDFSANQLAAARPHIAEARVRFPLVRGNAEELPFADGSFDLVFCDHGAIGFTDPGITVPEVARVLRPGGRLVCNTATPFIWVTWPMVDGPPGRELVRSYFDSTRMEWDPDEPGVTDYQLTYGGWIRLFRSCGLVVEDLIELRPAAAAESSFTQYATLAWARDFPAEHIWKVRKEPA